MFRSRLGVAKRGAREYRQALRIATQRRGNWKVRARELLEVAAFASNADAQYALGTWHLHGVGMRKNPRAAADLLERAARQGHAAAPYDLAICFETAAGRRRSERDARFWYRRAALQGDPDA